MIKFIKFTHAVLLYNDCIIAYQHAVYSLPQKHALEVTVYTLLRVSKEPTLQKDKDLEVGCFSIPDADLNAIVTILHAGIAWRHTNNNGSIHH